MNRPAQFLPPTQWLDRVLRDHTRDMSGKVVAITGTTSGTGYVCARELAKLGAQVLLLNRPSERADRALDQLRTSVPGGTFEGVDCDLQSFKHVRAAAQSIRTRLESLDVLCHNAGVMALPDQATCDGYDVQMQTNSLSPFLLTQQLFPLLRAAKEARIVLHTSGKRKGADHDPRFFQRVGGALGGDGTAELNAQLKGPRWERYHQTKLANCTFAYELDARLAAADLSHVKVLLAHPGLAKTQLQVTTAETGGMDLHSEIMNRAQSPEDGALGILRACADPQAQSGDFYGPKRLTGFPARLTPEPLLLDPTNRRINWEGCEAAVGAFVLH